MCVFMYSRLKEDSLEAVEKELVKMGRYGARLGLFPPPLYSNIMPKAITMIQVRTGRNPLYAMHLVFTNKA